MQFIDKKYLYLSLKLTKVGSYGPIDKLPALGQVKAWLPTCDDPSPESTVTQFADSYMRHQAPLLQTWINLNPSMNK